MAVGVEFAEAGSDRPADPRHRSYRFPEPTNRTGTSGPGGEERGTHKPLTGPKKPANRPDTKS
jgi:hypothetical protein